MLHRKRQKLKQLVLFHSARPLKIYLELQKILLPAIRTPNLLRQSRCLEPLLTMQQTKRNQQPLEIKKKRVVLVSPQKLPPQSLVAQTNQQVHCLAITTSPVVKAALLVRQKDQLMRTPQMVRHQPNLLCKKSQCMVNRKVAAVGLHLSPSIRVSWGRPSWRTTNRPHSARS